MIDESYKLVHKQSTFCKIKGKALVKLFARISSKVPASNIVEIINGIHLTLYELTSILTF